MESVSVATLDELPVIDISPLYNEHAGQEAKQAVAQQMHQACIDTGFFYVSGHKVTQQPMFDCMRQLFDQPLNAKEKLDANLSPLHRGYTGLGGSHNCVPKDSCVVGPDRKESYLLGAEGTTSPMHGNNTWPDLPDWQQQVHRYFSGMLELSRVVARGLALSLGLPESFFTDKLQDPVAQLLLLRYPPPPSASSTRQQDTAAAAGPGANGLAEQQQQQRQELGTGQQYVGCGAHTDCGFLTILAQDDVPGLQVKIASNKWVIAPAIPGAFVVNLGDMTQRWTNDLYKSTKHRVFNSSSKPRYSAPFFCNCDFDAVVEPAAIAAASGAGGDAAAAAAKYGPIKAGHYIMQKLGLMWDAKIE